MSDQSKACDESSKSLTQLAQDAVAGRVGRRDFLRRAVVAGITSSAAYKLLSETNAAAQSGTITTFAVGEEGSLQPPIASPSPNPPQYIPPQYNPVQPPQSPSPNPPTYNPPQYNPPSQATTYAVGEENTYQPTTSAVGEENTYQATTLAVGEENSRPPTLRPPTVPPSNATSARVGEESSYTTYAVGEESSPSPIPSPQPGRPTTLSVGEETGGISKPTFRPNVSTRALGEENRVNPFPSIKIPSIKIPSPGRNIPMPWKNFRRW